MSHRPNRQYSLFPPFVNPANRGSLKECSLCSSPYGFLNAQHICKRCCRSVCEECVGCLEHPIIKTNYSQSLHKICRPCKNEYDLLSKYAEMYKLCFFTNSLFVTQWMKSVNLRSVKEKKVFMGYINEEDVAGELWHSLNYSLREFTVIVCGQCEKEKLEEILLRVARLVVRLRNILSVELEKVAYLVLLLSIHCEEETALQASVQVFEQIISGVSEERVLAYIEMYGSHTESSVQSTEGEEQSKHQAPELQLLSEMEREKLRDYLESRFVMLTNNMGINSLSAELAVYFLNLTLTKRSAKEFQKGIAALLISHNKVIASGNYKVDDIDKCILRDSNSKAVTNIVRKLTEIEAEPVPTRKDSVKCQTKLEKRPTVQLATESCGLVVRLREENKRLIEREQAYINEIQFLKSKVNNKSGNESSDGSSESDVQDQLEEKPSDLQESDKKIISNEQSSRAVRSRQHGSRPPRKRRGHSNQNQTTLLQEIVLKKNLRIDQLQSQCDHLEYDLQESQKLVKSLQQQLQTIADSQQPETVAVDAKNIEIEQLKGELEKLRNEKKNMAHMNELLLRKFNEISRQLLDKEEKDIEQTNLAVDEKIDEMLSQQEMRDKLANNECTTF